MRKLLFLFLLIPLQLGAADITCIWDASPSGADGYRVKYSTNVDLSNPTVIDVGPSLGAKFTIPNGSVYYIWVVAYYVSDPKPDIESGPSNIVKLPLGGPVPPPNFRATAVQP